MGPKWKAYQDASQRRREAVEWLKHIGAEGRRYSGGQDRLNLSRGHATVQFCIAGQYTEGGQNYRESPKAFNVTMLDIIHERFGELRAEVERRLREQEAIALTQAREEVEATLVEIDQASAALATGKEG